MKKLVVLNLTGSLESGVSVLLEIGEDDGGSRFEIAIGGNLSPALSLKGAYASWQTTYHNWSGLLSRIAPKKIVHQRSIENMRSSCEESALALRGGLNKWLQSDSFRPVRETWLKELGSNSEPVRVIVRSQNPSLRQLPWHLWDVIENSPNAEVALSNMEFQQRHSPSSANFSRKVNILAIIGDSTGIDVSRDRQVLSDLPGASVLFLDKPRREWISEHLWERDWDILFFAGHSKTENDRGRIYVNETESFTIHDLKRGLKKAISKGLKLAIFNSCDGLGLAQELADLHIPQVIVMREPVPDLVAQEFLIHFLTAFSRGQPLYTSIREARDRLEMLEDQYPCASWLPVIFQNPGSEPPIWEELRGGAKRKLFRLSRERQQNLRPSFANYSLQTVLILSLLVAGIVVFGRYLGLLQNWELQTMDSLMQLRPEEGPDPRLLVIEVTEDDFQLQQQKHRTGSLSDEALKLVLLKLKYFQAATVGLDIYRDFPTTDVQLAQLLNQSHNLFAICKIRDAKRNHPGVSPPPEISAKRRTFSDGVDDGNDLERRYLLGMLSQSIYPCSAQYSIGAQIAFDYLAKKGLPPKTNKQRNIQIGDVVLEPLKPHTGGYQSFDTSGYQVLLNYRSYGPDKLLDKIAQRITLRDFLAGNLNPQDIKDKIVLIGVTAPTVHDYILTPYLNGQGFYQKIPGVISHAQMVSQILSAVLDHRPLLSVWPWWSDALWIFGWSLAGGILVMQGRSPVVLGGGILVLAISLGGICYILLLNNGLWVPIVPSFLALGVTSSIVLVGRSRIIPRVLLILLQYCNVYSS